MLNAFVLPEETLLECRDCEEISHKDNFMFNRLFSIALLAAACLPLQAAFNIGDVFASIGNGKVQRFSSTGTLLQTMDTGLGGFTTGSVFDAAGNFYVTTFSAGTVAKFDNNGVLLNANYIAGLSAPESLVFDSAGNLYVGQAGGNIRMYTATGTFIKALTTSGNTDWIDLAADQTTMFYTHESPNILRINAATNTLLADFANPGGTNFAFRLLGDGGLLSASTTRVIRLNAAGAITQTYTPALVSLLFALNLDPDGTTFWTGDANNGAIHRYNISSGALVNTFPSGAPGNFFGLSIFGQITQAVTQSDAFLVRYASNLTSGDSVINLTNTGANGAALNGPGFGGAAGNICVNVYAFSPDEQLVSCCSCLITPNGLVSLSANLDLISNTLTGVRPNSIVIKLVNTGASAAFTGTNCTNSAAQAGGTAFPLAGGLVAFGTTVHNASGAGSFAVTETPFLRASLSPAELASINNRCTNIIGNGSTFGICRSCRVGGLNQSR